MIEQRLGLAESQVEITDQQTQQGTEPGSITGRFHVRQQGGGGAVGAARANQVVQ